MKHLPTLWAQVRHMGSLVCRRHGGCAHPYVAWNVICLFNGGSSFSGMEGLQLGLQDEPGMWSVDKSHPTQMLLPTSGREHC